jgi:integrase
MVAATDAGLISARDRALILLGFAGAFRRSELVGLDAEDCTFGRDGLTITLRRSKTDQDSAGRKIGIPYGANPETCPVRVVQSWIEQAGITTGPLFQSINRHGRIQPGRLSGIDVARVVKKLAERAGLDPAKFAGHSLRAGHATSAAIAGASERSIMNQAGHRSVQMVRRYIRDGSFFRETARANWDYSSIPLLTAQNSYPRDGFLTCSIQGWSGWPEVAPTQSSDFGTVRLVRKQVRVRISALNFLHPILSGLHLS